MPGHEQCLRLSDFPSVTNILIKEPERVSKISDYDNLMGLGITTIPTSGKFGPKS